MTTSRLWLVLVFVLFCLPLFVSLGRGDLRGDEAIYSFGVDRILETREWLFPKSSPHEDAAFLEKPPLKFWIVAAPIRWGLLPLNEFGLRFWDAVFGSVAFLYVFAIGAKLAGPACGLIACLVLFAHRPLFFEHGLRSNNMEAALLLSYCGGVFHYLEWANAKHAAGAAGGRAAASGWAHALSAGIFFVLGFMTKFVAALFLPPVLLTATLVTPKWRTKLVREWKVWALVAALIVVLCLPWFVVAQARFGSTLWQIMLGEHVYRRFSNYLDPAHLNPWHYYITQMYRELVGSQAALFVLAGLVFMAVQAWRKRSPELLVILLWLVIPTFLISIGTSKLYHYAYPFLPPLGLAAGCLGAFMLAVLPLPLARALPTLTMRTRQRLPGVAAAVGRPMLRGLFLAIAVVAIVIAFTGLYGSIRLALPGGLEFRSSGVLRPAVIAMVFGLLGGVGARAGQLLVPLIVASLLPLPGYGATLSRLDDEPDAMHTSVACVQSLRGGNPSLPSGLYLDVPDNQLSHAMYYYFRRLRPWIRPPGPAPEQLAPFLSDPAELRPVVVSESTYQVFRKAHGSAAALRPSLASTTMVTLDEDVLLLLPGAYAKCHTGGSARLPVR